VSRSLNKVMLIGNVGADPDVRSAGTGNRVANFNLATTRTWNGPSGERQEKTEWHRCSVWNSKVSNLADFVEKYVRKGQQLYVEGRVEYRTYQDKEGQTRYATDVVVREILLLGSRGASAAGGGGGGGGTDAEASPSYGGGRGTGRTGAPERARTAAGSPGSRAGGAAEGSEGGGTGGTEDFEDFPGALDDEDDDLPF
jgi:single-strand DNA-binding protein